MRWGSYVDGPVSRIASVGGTVKIHPKGGIRVVGPVRVWVEDWRWELRITQSELRHSDSSSISSLHFRAALSRTTRRDSNPFLSSLAATFVQHCQRPDVL